MNCNTTHYRANSSSVPGDPTDSRIGAIDRGLGFLFGAARGLLLVVIALLFFGWLVQPPPTWVANAQSKPMLDDLGEKLLAALPDDIETAIMKQFNQGTDSDPGAAGGTGEAAPAAPDVDDAPVVGDEDYGTTTRQNLDQLIQNSDN